MAETNFLKGKYRINPHQYLVYPLAIYDDRKCQSVKNEMLV